MKMIAQIKTASYPHKNWEAKGRLGGSIAGVRFRKSGKVFIAEDIDPGAHEKLAINPFVQIEISSHASSGPSETTLANNVIEGSREYEDSHPPARRRGRPRKNS